MAAAAQVVLAVEELGSVSLCMGVPLGLWPGVWLSCFSPECTDCAVLGGICPRGYMVLRLLHIRPQELPAGTALPCHTVSLQPVRGCPGRNAGRWRVPRRGDVCWPGCQLPCCPPLHPSLCVHWLCWLCCSLPLWEPSAGWTIPSRRLALPWVHEDGASCLVVRQPHFLPQPFLIDGFLGIQDLNGVMRGEQRGGGAGLGPGLGGPRAGVPGEKFLAPGGQSGRRTFCPHPEGPGRSQMGER
nr:uncharacterized protein LOC105489904 [Macaca nemestrina]